MTRRSLNKIVLATLVFAVIGFGCIRSEDQPETLRLATTTSTYDSGLLDEILPEFEDQYDATVEVIAVGTGQALELGERGDVDVMLVHARSREDTFIDEGYGINRQDVMWNDFVIVGPGADPAGVTNATAAAEAFDAISGSDAAFASRGDDSGTHIKELAIWAEAGIEPDPSSGWYNSLGQGMGETLIVANELDAYALTDRATFLAMRENIPRLEVLFGGASVSENPDPILLNPYGVIQVNPELHDGINAELAANFVAWLISADTQGSIGIFGTETFGQPIFNPVYQEE